MHGLIDRVPQGQAVLRRDRRRAARISSATRRWSSHNAAFDLGFLNAELERAGRPLIARERLVDTLMLARRKHPGGSNRLDDLCARYAHRQFAPHQARRAARCRAAGRSLCRADRRAAGAACACRRPSVPSATHRRPIDRARTPGAAGAARDRRRSRGASRRSSPRSATTRSGWTIPSTPSNGLSRLRSARWPAAACAMRWR